MEKTVAFYDLDQKRENYNLLTVNWIYIAKLNI